MRQHSTMLPAGPFDSSYMRKLYELGRQAMLKGKAWHETPPGYDPTPFNSIVQGASTG
jgi:hypothetical protein